LHIFEPRYRQMVGDSLEGESMIGMVLLKPGWERSYFGEPPVYEHGTLGEIERAVEYDDGRYDIVLKGLVRYRVLEHLEHEPYRVARVIADPELPPDPASSAQRLEELRSISKRYLSNFKDSEVPELDTASLPAIINALVMALNIEPYEKQTLLEVSDLMSRADTVNGLIQERLKVIDFLAPYRREAPPGMN
ncbi:MAG: LON peptidase substrate-binding domain-containing protein, partial [Thermoanaerobaculia bacterium]|nr:LON peptidase substrate-binding domain-containing protein [Thermoanaerobaculia bacterium]